MIGRGVVTSRFVRGRGIGYAPLIDDVNNYCVNFATELSHLWKNDDTEEGRSRGRGIQVGI